MDENISIKTLIDEEIGIKNISDRVLQMFNFIQELLENDENTTASGNLKNKSLNLVKSQLIDLFEEDIYKLKLMRDNSGP